MGSVADICRMCPADVVVSWAGFGLTADLDEKCEAQNGKNVSHGDPPGTIAGWQALEKRQPWLIFLGGARIDVGFCGAI
jgi:hypothetical protein